MILSVCLCGCAAPADKALEKTAVSEAVSGAKCRASIHSTDLRKTVFALVSSAENSTIDYGRCYSYIKDINDGRGYTAGIIGFCSGTGDLLEVVKLYSQLKRDDPLQSYLPALEKVNGTDSHDGLGEGFEAAWKKACEDPQMKEAQDMILDQNDLKPALEDAAEDGLGPLGQYIYYDAYVVHGDIAGIRQKAEQEKETPAEGGDEAQYLTAFLKARQKIMQEEEAHEDLSCLKAQQKFIDEGNFFLSLPLAWTMYGDSYTLTEKDLDDLPGEYHPSV